MKHLITILFALVALSSTAQTPDTIKVYVKYQLPSGAPFYWDTVAVNNAITNAINSVVHPPTDLGISGNTITSSTGAGVDISSLLGSSDNIYTADGTLTGHRLINQGSNNVAFDISSGAFRIGTTTDLQSSSERFSVSGFSVFRNDNTSLSPLYLYNNASSDSHTPFLAFRNSGGIRAGIGLNNTVGPDLHIGSIGDIYFDNSANGTLPKMMIEDGTGDVGIGITAPVSKLTVFEKQTGSDPHNILTVAGGTTLRNTGPSINFAQVWTGAHANWQIGRISSRYSATTTWGGDLIFEVNDGFGQNNLSEAMKITPNGALRLNAYGSETFSTSGTHAVLLAADEADGDIVDDTNIYFKNGNIGIGTDNPQSNLEVRASTASQAYIDLGDVSTPRMRFGYANPATSINTPIVQAQMMSDPAGNLHVMSRGNWPSYVRFTTSTGTSPLERMRITSAGNVGIGTAGPSSKLHVYGTGKVAEFGNGSQADQHITFGGNRFRFGYASPNGYLAGGAGRGIEFRVNNQSTASFKFLSNGSASFTDYGTGLFAGTAAYVMGIEADGDMIEVDINSIGADEQDLTFNAATGELSLTGDPTPTVDISGLKVPRTIAIQIVARSADPQTGSSEAYFIVPPEYDGLVCKEARHMKASGTGNSTFQIRHNQTPVGTSTSTGAAGTVTVWNHTDFTLATNDIVDFNITVAGGHQGLSATISCE